MPEPAGPREHPLVGAVQALGEDIGELVFSVQDVSETNSRLLLLDGVTRLAGLYHPMASRAAWGAIGGVLIGTLGMSSPAQAITIAFANPPDYFESLVVEGAWKGVGKVKTGGDRLCTGTLISKQHVLTAAHCFFSGSDGKGEQVSTDIVRFQLASEFNDEEFKALQVILPDDYDPGLGHRPPRMDENGVPKGAGDLAVILLEKPLEGTTIYAYNTGRIPDERKPTLKTVKVGYGLAGNGDEGAKPGTSGMKRQMINMVDQVSDGKTQFNTCKRCPITPPAKTLLYDFDDPTVPRVNATDLKNHFHSALADSVAVDPIDVMGKEAKEGSPASGDSGGPLFQFDGDTPILVGVTSSGSDRPQSFLDTASSRFGNLAFDTRVLDYKDFIARALPEPPSLALVALGLGILVHRRHQRY